MFIGREKELEILDELYEKNCFETAIISGRRRVGKSTLITEFIKDKPVIFYSAFETSSIQNLEALSKAIWESNIENEMDKGVFTSFENAFEYIFKLSEHERLIFVIDEYENLDCDETVSPLLFSLIEKYRSTSKMLLILCGPTQPLEDNLDSTRIELCPFSFSTLHNFFPEKTWNERAILYGVFSGIPFYLDRLGHDELENTIKAFFDKNSFFMREPEDLLRRDVKKYL